MNFAEKVRFFFEPDALARAPLENRWRYALTRYCRYRRSRFGIKRIITKAFNSAHYEIELNEIPYFKLRTRMVDFGDRLAIEEVFLQKIYDFNRVPDDIDLIVDVGAHIGGFTLLAHKYFPDVPKICVEPDGENFRLLRYNLTANGVEATLHNVAVSNFDGQANIFGLSGIGLALVEGNEPGVRVTVKRLSNLVGFSKANSLLLKCDTEGSEFSILEDIMAYLPEKTFIFVEVHEGESAVFRLRHVLSQYGFSVEETVSKGLWRDCVAYRRLSGGGS